MASMADWYWSRCLAPAPCQPPTDGHPVKKTCDICSNEFEARVRTAKYCSTECKDEGRRRTQRADKKPTVTCAVCEAEFTGSRSNAKYCSKDCAAEGARNKSRRPQVGEKHCGLLGCTKTFTPQRSNQKYCGRECANEAQKLLKKGAAELDDVLDSAHTRDLERKNRAELRKILAAENRMRRYETILRECITEHDPTPLVVPKVDVQGDESEHEWILALGDWHTGQKTTIEQTGGMYEQDISTTRDQVAKIWKAVLQMYEIEKSGRSIKKLHILGLGDFVDGDDMRPSQHRHVEEVVTVQVIQAFDLLVWLIRQLLTIFPEIELDMIGGNHDRVGRNRGDAGLGELDYIDTYAWLLGAFIQRTLAEDIDAGRLKVRNWETFFGYKKIAGKRIVFEHGASFRWGGGYGGVPWYGISALGPRYGQMLGEPDLVFLGHGHRPALIPHGEGWIVANGALPATSTYVQSSFKTVQRPQQWLVSMHRRLGVTGFQPIYCDVPGQLKPGMIWEDTEHYATMANPRSRRP